MTEQEQLQKAITVLEAQRRHLGDEVVDPLLALAHEKLIALGGHQRSGAQHQRKQVTVLFADLSGFTVMAGLMDAEDVADLMNALWQRLDLIILAHGGVIDKHIGDAVMALWGSETAREDDPEQAVRAGLALQDALTAFSAHFVEQRDNQRMVGMAPAAAALRLRIGINTGPALLGTIGTTSEFTAMGDTVNVASRLEHAAPTIGVLISHATYQHIRSRFVIETLEPLMVRGKQERLPVYLVLRSQSDTFRIFARSSEGIETPLIGRDVELDQLSARLLTAQRDSSMQAVTIVGDAGMGKSRLLYEFSQRLSARAPGVAVLSGRASHGMQQLPYALIRDLLSSWLRTVDDGDSPLREKLARAAETLLGSGGGEAAQLISYLLNIDADAGIALRGIRDDTRQIHNRAAHALARLLSAIATQTVDTSSLSRSVILILDDVHAADSSSLELLQKLFPQMHGIPLLAIFATRPILFEGHPAWGRDLPQHIRLDLPILSDTDVQQLVSGILRMPPHVPEALLHLIADVAEGNPFYVEELIKMLIDDGIIQSDSSGCQVALDRLSSIHVPSTLTGVIQARIDVLTSDERETLQHAALIGRVFWDSAVAFLAEEQDETRATRSVPPRLLACLNALEQKEMIFPRASSTFAGTREYIFKHAVLRDVVVESVLRRHRRRGHSRAACWMRHASLRTQQTDTFAAQIAEHHAAAGETEDAVLWYSHAGTRAAEQFANVEAIAHFGQALAGTAATATAKQFSLLLAREQVYDLQGMRREQQSDLAALSALAELLDDDLRRAEVALRLARYAETTGDAMTAVNAAQIALARAQAASAPPLEAAAELAWGRALLRQSDYARAIGCFARCLALARQAQLTRLEADSLQHLGIVALERGRSIEAWGYLEDALQLTRAAGDRRGESQALSLLGSAAASQGDYPGARAAWEEALHLFREVGDRRNEGAALNHLGTAQASQGEYGRACAAFDRALTIYRETGDRYGESRVLSNLGAIACALGDHSSAHRSLADALRLQRESGDREQEGQTLTTLALLCEQRRESAAALDHSRHALRIAQDVGARHLEARALTQVGHASASAGLPDDAALRYQQAFELQQRLGAFNMALEPRAGLAQLALDSGDVAQAQAHVSEILSYLALITLDGADDPLRVYLVCYRVLHTTQDPRAGELLRTAHARLQELAAWIEDPALRRSYLEEVPTNRALMQAWSAATAPAVS